MSADPVNYPAARISREDFASEGDVQAVTNPGNGEVVATTSWSTPANVESAVRAAAAVRNEWSNTPARNRGDALRAIAAKLRSSADRLAPLIAGESGKRIAEAHGEVELSAKYFDWFSEAAIAMEEGQQRTTSARRFLINRHAVGVVAALGTWNFPLSIPARKIAAALAAGCPVILKPSEVTPLSGYEIVKLADPELPSGTLNYVIGDSKALSNELIDHADVAAVSFTGSTKVGREVGIRAAGNFTRATLELGGRAPFIVRHDADVASAVDTLMIAKFRNNGESCIAANNVFIHDSLYEQFLQEFADRLQTIRCGDQFDEATDLGPLISVAAADRLRNLVNQARTNGNRIWSGRRDQENPAYLEPTMVESTEDDDLWNQEVFGPVCPVRSYTDEDGLVEEINGWGVGLAGYVCSGESGHATKLAERLRIGIIGINNGTPNTPEVPFGGFGDSGIGREGSLTGMFEFTEEQTISIAH